MVYFPASCSKRYGVFVTIGSLLGKFSNRADLVDFWPKSGSARLRNSTFFFHLSHWRHYSSPFNPDQATLLVAMFLSCILILQLYAALTNSGFHGIRLSPRPTPLPASSSSSYHPEIGFPFR